MSDTCAIVLAAGHAERFGGRKQFAVLGGRRLVDHAVTAALAACDAVVVVLPAGHRWDGARVHAAVRGGATRAASVRAGLAAVPDQTEIVVVTDAAHPVAHVALFERVIAAVRAGASAAVCGITPDDVVKQVADGQVVATLPRDCTIVTQVPQAFRAELLRNAHAGTPDGTEDSAMVEAVGAPVTVVPGDRHNVHVTDRLSLAFAEAALAMAQP